MIIVFITIIVMLAVGPIARGQNPYNLECFASINLGKYYTSQILTDRVQESGGKFENSDSVLFFLNKDSIAIKKKRKELLVIQSEQYRQQKSKKFLSYLDSLYMGWKVDSILYKKCMTTTVTLSALGFTESTEKSVVLKKILNSKVKIGNFTYIVTLCPAEAAAEYLITGACQLGIGNAYFMIEPIKCAGKKPIDFLEVRTDLSYGTRCKGYCPCKRDSYFLRLLTYPNSEERNTQKYFSPNERLVFQLKRIN